MNLLSQKVVETVNEYASYTQQGRSDVYNWIYDILHKKHGIDVRLKIDYERMKLNEEYFKKKGKYYAESTLKSKVKGIDVMERMGVLDKFYRILYSLLAEAKGFPS
jgi:hypothetical protein